MYEYPDDHFAQEELRPSLSINTTINTT